MDVAFLRNDIGLEAGDSLKILNLSDALTARLQLWDRVSQRFTGLSQPLLQSA